VVVVVSSPPVVVVPDWVVVVWSAMVGVVNSVLGSPEPPLNQNQANADPPKARTKRPAQTQIERLISIPRWSILATVSQ
jgi:hypothetical protein